MNHGSGARNRTGMPRPKSHEKTDFGYGFGYVSLDTKNVSLDTKNVSLDTKNVSLDMAISLWIWPLVVLRDFRIHYTRAFSLYQGGRRQSKNVGRRALGFSQ